MSKTFLYFAYGSNLLSQRIHINNPTAVRYGIGKLDNYRLDFITFSSRWKGASATIVPQTGSHVWGAVWKIDMKNMPDLDRQEGVGSNIYFPMEVAITNEVGDVCECRVYQQTATPTYVDLKNLPENRRPSPIYLKIIQLGAEESNLPSDYIQILSEIVDNGYSGKIDIGLDLKL